MTWAEVGMGVGALVVAASVLTVIGSLVGRALARSARIESRPVPPRDVP